MPKNEIDPEKALKTGVVLGLINLILSPLWLLDAKLGVTASIALSAVAVYQFAQLGRERRPGSNAVNTANNFFVSLFGGSSTDMENTTRNVANGGAAVFDEGAKILAKALK